MLLCVAALIQAWLKGCGGASLPPALPYSPTFLYSLLVRPWRAPCPEGKSRVCLVAKVCLLPSLCALLIHTAHAGSRLCLTAAVRRSPSVPHAALFAEAGLG